jgi:peptide/nickel transport system ATP-binding protein
MDKKQDQAVLFRIQNLKQYFPVGRGRYCKANDGITLDIYSGETLGLVGESGCGKSTLGRTLLQLYRQTDGRSLYYGRTEHELAPKYVKKTIRKLEKLRKLYREAKEDVKKAEKAYESAPEGKHKFIAQEELQNAQTKESNALFDMTKVVGGLIVYEDLSEVKKRYMLVFDIAKNIRNIELKKLLVERDYADAVFKVEKLNEQGKSSDAALLKAEKHRERIEALDNQIEEKNIELSAAEVKLNELREAKAGDPEFEKYEAMRDDGIDLARLSYNEIRHLRSDLQMIFQDPYSSLNPRMTVANIIGEGLRAHGKFKKRDERMQEHILKAMDDAGLQSYFIYRYPHQFSGGQRQRIGIARSLAMNPKFIVCDEAVSALDVSIQSQIINLLKDLKDEQDLTYLFITHDLSVIKYISDRVAVMYLGNIVELAPTDELFENPRHPYTQALMSAIPTTDLDDTREMIPLEGDIPSPVNPPDGCKFNTRCSYRTEVCFHVVPEWEEVGNVHFVACHHKLPVGSGIGDLKNRSETEQLNSYGETEELNSNPTA